LSEQALLQRLSYAGSLIHSGDTQAAAKELSNSLSNPDAKSAAGFVIGEILIRDRRFAEAAQIYLQVLQDNPDFPEIHGGLSLALTESDNDEEGLREAKLALKENPNDAVAHRSAGLALRSARNYPAAKLELEASIRCKPDYDVAYGSLGILLDESLRRPPSRRNFLKAGVVLATGLSGVALLPEPGVSEESDAWVIGPKPGFTPEIGTLTSMLAFTRMQVLNSVKGMSQADLDFLFDGKANTIGALLLHLAATDSYYHLNSFRAWPGVNFPMPPNKSGTWQ
jgi:Tetratricopeptide repeat